MDLIYLYVIVSLDLLYEDLWIMCTDRFFDIVIQGGAKKPDIVIQGGAKKNLD